MNIFRKLKNLLDSLRKSDRKIGHDEATIESNNHEKVTFESEIRRWFRDDGDNTLRLDYDLTEDSIVFDLGGYQGDFAHNIFDKHSCFVYLFEPSKSFYDSCVKRFRGNAKVKCFNYALSNYNGSASLSTSDDASSIIDEVVTDDNEAEEVEVREFVEVLKDLNIESVALIKINIEGGEYTIIPHMLENQLATRFENLQIQFHNFVENAEVLRNQIRSGLENTHRNNWCYEFVWENWELKHKGD